MHIIIIIIIIINMVIDADEDRNLATFNVPGAYLQS